MVSRMSAYGDPRSGYPPVDFQLESETLLKLHRLAGYETDNSNPNGEIEKDAKAREALELAGSLIGPLIRWAINHEAGQKLEKIGPAVSWLPHDRATPKDYQARTSERNRLANSHQNECRGAAYAGGDPIVERQIAAAVIWLISKGMNFNPGAKIASGLELLDQGEVVAILQPIKTSSGRGRKNWALLIDRHQLRALQHVEFRRGGGSKEASAQIDVAKAYKVTSAALDKWSKELPKNMDPAIVDFELRRARWFGALAAAKINPQRQRKLSPLQQRDFYDPAKQSDIAKSQSLFGDRQLVKDGKLFNNISAEAKAMEGRRK